MAVPSYTTDLTTLSQAEESGAPPTGWAEPTATGWTALNQITGLETDFFIQNTNCISATVKTGVGGLLYNAGSGITIPADGAVLLWAYFTAPGCLDSEANGGMRMLIGNALNAFNWVSVGGKDAAPNPYGGWQCFAMGDPPSIPGVTGVGGPTTTKQYIGWCYNCPSTAPSKGNPYGVDAIRYGRCELRIAGGQAGGYATFAGAAAQNDAQVNRWGLLQAVAGGYQWQGLMTLGYGALTDFRDSNAMILVANTKRVTANFNRIEIRNASSRVDWTSCTFVALGTQSKGRLEVVDDADVNITGCSFAGMDTFVFKANSTILSSVFRGCGQVTQSGATFTGCSFTRSTAAAALLVNSSAAVTQCAFTSAGTGHAIQGFGAAGTYDISTLTFSAYAASNGSTGNEAIYVTATSGTVNLNVVGTPSVRTAGATVNLISGQVTLTISPIAAGSDVVIYEAGTATIIENSQNIAGTSYQYVYSAGQAGSSIDIGLFKEGLIPFYVRNYELGSSSATVPAAQQADRFYL